MYCRSRCTSLSRSVFVHAEVDGLASTAEAEGGVENMLLVALTSLYTDEREADVRQGVLRVAINVLQRHGTFQML
jgi:hypothetical protein